MHCSETPSQTQTTELNWTLRMTSNATEECTSFVIRDRMLEKMQAILWCRRQQITETDRLENFHCAFRKLRPVNCGWHRHWMHNAHNEIYWSILSDCVHPVLHANHASMHIIYFVLESHAPELGHAFAYTLSPCHRNRWAALTSK